MTFDRSDEIDAVCQQMRWADYYRGQNRALINGLSNGEPPISPEDASEQGVEVNYSDLSLTRAAHDARSQLANAFMKPGNYFKCTTDMGSLHRRSDYGAIVTREMNRIMKRSIPYFEKYRSTFALDVLHGIGPGVWQNPDKWCPKTVGIDDVFIPGGTTLDMDDLPFYAIRHSWTAPQLIRKIRAPQLDPGWNVPLAEACLEWIDQQTQALIGSTYQDMWSPEKIQERVKSDGCQYAGDQVPTLNVFDFHFWHDDGKVAGWRRRIILDAWSAPNISGGQVTATRRTEKPFGSDYKGQFLYSSGNDVYSSSRQEVISFQFADLSAVGPFKYHSVRSLGFLLYAICHIQNRMRCKFTESVFEALMMYFRVKTEADMQRALKVKLWNRGFIDETLEFVPANQRFQVNAQLVELGLKMNDQQISDSASSYTQNNNFSRDRTEKTKFQVMAEVNAAQSLVSAGLQQAYMYQEMGEDREILRRFMKADSTDPDVKTFRAACLRQRVPERIMIPEAWDCRHERVMGNGNKTQEMTIAEFLMSNREKFDPESQRTILHDVTLAVSDNAGLADELVPMKAMHVSDSKHDAQLAIGPLLQGFPVDIRSGMNHQEYCQEILRGMAMQVKKINDRGGVATQAEIEGLVNAGHHTEEHIKLLAQDEKQNPLVKQFGDVLGRIMNETKAFAQRLAQQKQQAQQNGNGQLDPKDAARVKGMMIQAQTKSQLAKSSHAERTAQKRLSFEQQLKQKEQQHQADIAAKDLETASEITRNRLRSTE